MVNIKNENFEKLSQLDRIEFRQRWKENKIDFDISDYAWYVLIIAAIFGLSGNLEICANLLLLAFVVFMIQLFILILCSIIHRKRQRKLTEEYFDIVVKKRGNK